MAASRRPPQLQIAHPFIWRPGDGLNAGCVQRMRARFPRPLKPMGEAWFIGEERRMFDFLLADLDHLSLHDLRAPLDEIAAGNACFGPMDEWTRWYRYLLAHLVPRHHAQSFDSLYQRLVTAFIAIHPRAIDEPYPGFADDARHTLGRCLMDPLRWDAQRLALAAPEDPRASEGHFAWSVAYGDFSAGMFFCAKYLAEDELPGWLDSVFAIDCPLWTTQLYTWLLATSPLLCGDVLELPELDCDTLMDVVWHGAHVLKGDFSGCYEPAPSPLPLLPPDRCQAVLAAARRHVSQARYFAWLDAIKPHAYLETMLGDMPNRFEVLFEIGA
ncbi:hypothetical protein J7373_14025 [Xanthomonas sp. A2111]|uniref:Uncharacterized protein n=1 Tax=Xanthomonas hawaiiensis TaxID=3003247 RepID=A0ABU2I8A5_9XANT|nr:MULTISPECIES: hypothetical protein [unclassified Xanthomonas]MBO9829366.1 hypothetical protein [Xanthomonas sp. A2111]MBO9875185.1 hypothetical protein [Xanthomonas sp. D-93]MDS9993873.1 hypothetical protein [Xanthomonas sp. A2111]WNH45609.1 hypothetical protein PG878_03820 [Xanthomonas sp. A6251]